MADVSPDIIERVVLGITGAAATTVAFVGGWMFNHLKNENKQLREEIEKYKDKNNEAIEALVARIEQHPSMAHCDAKQELWTERLSSFREVVESNNKVNGEQHQSIATTLTQLSSEQRETTKCLSMLAAGLDSCE